MGVGRDQNFLLIGLSFSGKLAEYESRSEELRLT